MLEELTMQLALVSITTGIYKIQGIGVNSNNDGGWIICRSGEAIIHSSALRYYSLRCFCLIRLGVGIIVLCWECDVIYCSLQVAPCFFLIGSWNGVKNNFFIAKY
jgi:hypothetical protein